MCTATYRDTESVPAHSRLRRPMRYRLMSIGNAIPRRILRSPMHGLMSGGFILLAFAGRTTGRVYQVPVAWQEHDGTLLVGTDRPWRKNLRTGDRIDVWFKGRERPAAVEVLTDEEEVGRLLGIILPRNPVLARFMAIRLESDRSLDRDDLRRAVDRGAAVIRLRLV